jgi:hypothetical protein
VELVGPDDKPLGAGRNLADLRERLKQAPPKVTPAGENPLWRRLAQQWERVDLTGWTFGDAPERLTVDESGHVPLYAWPALVCEEERVHLRLLYSQEAARRASLGGIQRLVSLALQKDLAWLHKDLRALARFEPLLAGFCPLDKLVESAFENLHRHLLPVEVFPALTTAHFQAAVAAARSQLPGLAMKLVDNTGIILKLRQEVARRCGPASAPATPAAGTRLRSLSDLRQLDALTVAAASAPANPWAAELAALLPPDFLATTPHSQVPHLHRYLKALLIRIERASMNPAKDQERRRQLAPYLDTLKTFADTKPASAEVARELYATAKEHGVAFIDAPVSGGQAGAENGVLTVMCGGDAGTFEKAEKVIAAYARACNLMGEAGSGQLAKMVNQICIAGLVQGLSEGLHFAKKAGLDIEKLVATISKGDPMRSHRYAISRSIRLLSFKSSNKPWCCV